MLAVSLRLTRVLGIKSRVELMLGRCPTVVLVCEWVQQRNCCLDCYVFRGKVFNVSKRENI